MSAQDLKVIDYAAQTAHAWVNELTARLDWRSKRSALRLLRVTLHQIRDHLLVDELAQFSAQLPLLIRGMLFEGWVPKNTPIKERKAAQFIASIETALGETEEYRGAGDVRCVFDALNVHLTAGEIEDVRASLPEDIRAMWPRP